MDKKIKKRKLAKRAVSWVGVRLSETSDDWLVKLMIIIIIVITTDHHPFSRVSLLQIFKIFFVSSGKGGH